MPATPTPAPTPRPLSREQARQNAAFLRALARTGNAREAARALGVHRSTFTKRRAKHPAFASQWDAALALAAAALTRGAPAPTGEARVIRTASGRVQLRRIVPGRLTRAAEQAFLLALSATANVRLSAAAAGFSHAAFYARRRQDPGFAREMRLALEQGYERLEMALLESVAPEAHTHDAWRDNDPPALPPMSVGQALQLLFLHQKEVRLGGTPEALRRRRGETDEMRSLRLQLLAEARHERSRENFRIAEAARRDRGEPLWRPELAHELPPPLPDLGQVTGWSKADPATVPRDPDVALFGGFRAKHLTPEQVEKGRRKRDG